MISAGFRNEISDTFPEPERGAGASYGGCGGSRLTTANQFWILKFGFSILVASCFPCSTRWLPVSGFWCPAFVFSPPASSLRLLTADFCPLPPGFFRDPLCRPATDDIGLITNEALWLWQTRSMQPRIVDQKPAFKTLPEFEAATFLRRHNDFGVRLAHQRLRRVAPPQMPFAKKRRGIAPRHQIVGDRPGTDRQRIEITAQPVFRRQHARQYRRARTRSERMRRHRLGEVDALRRQRVEVRRARVRIPRITARLRPPLRGHDPENVRSRGIHNLS